jgi:hypothetical protein
VALSLLLCVAIAEFCAAPSSARIAAITEPIKYPFKKMSPAQRVRWGELHEWRATVLGFGIKTYLASYLQRSYGNWLQKVRKPLLAQDADIVD